MNEKLKTEIMDEEVPVYYTYKDRVFRLLFKDKERLLTLYNALNDTAYTNADDLTVNTLENAIFMKMKNDLSFIIDCNMCLYEHQSTYCPNMPLRGLFYFTDLYKKLLKGTDLSVRRQIKIPTPHYIVFYNGTERKEEEYEQKLSDAYENDSNGCLELTVRTININYGHNERLLNKCRPLLDYARFVDHVRRNLKSMPLRKAVEWAVEECIENDILREFLLEHKAEVVAMSIYEYNEEYVRKSLYEDGQEVGYQQGHADGKTAGMTEMLVKNVESAMQNFKIDLEKACQGIGVTVEEYRKAKEAVQKEC